MLKTQELHGALPQGPLPRLRNEVTYNNTRFSRSFLTLGSCNYHANIWSCLFMTWYSKKSRINHDLSNFTNFYDHSLFMGKYIVWNDVLIRHAEHFWIRENEKYPLSYYWHHLFTKDIECFMAFELISIFKLNSPFCLNMETFYKYWFNNTRF